MIKTSQKVDINGIYLNIIKATYDKPTVNIILKGEKLKALYSKIRNKTRTGISVHLCHFYSIQY